MGRYVDATALAAFFSRGSREAQGLLPALVRRLVQESAKSEELVQLRIPEEDQIGLAGYDGYVEFTGRHRYVPKGASVWEMGTGSATGKANCDLGKRTEDPGQVVPSKTTYVCVSPRAWNQDKKRNWAAENKGPWRALKIIDSVDLGAWLDSAPATERWLADRMGIPVTGIWDLEGFLSEEVNGKYGVSVNAELLIGGREEAREQIGNWLRSDSRILTVEGETEEEATWFSAAALSLLGTASDHYAPARTLVATNPDVVDHLATVTATHVLVCPSAESRRRARASAGANVRLLFPAVRRAGPRSGGSGERISLGNVSRSAISGELGKLPITNQLANRIAKQCRGSLSAVLWALAEEGTLPLKWTTGEGAAELLPLLMAGQWRDEASESFKDRAILEKLGAKPFATLDEIVRKWQAPDGPLVRVNGAWRWVALDFAWDKLGKKLTTELLERFKTVFHEVMGTKDPALELDAKARWAASLYDKVHPYSKELRTGLVSSLVQLALWGENHPGEAADTAVRLIRDVLGDDKHPLADTWPSVARWLPQLAEANPTAFLDSAEELARDSACVQAMFEQGQWGESAGMHLLRALERLAWSRDHLHRVTGVLSRLAHVVPDERSGNRPFKTLSEIYMPWHPQTSADLAHRCQCIGRVFENHGALAWRLGMGLIPSGDAMAWGTAAPEWRDWKPDEQRTVAQQEIVDFVSYVVDCMAERLEHQPSLWPEMIPCLADVRRCCYEKWDGLLGALRRLVDANQLPSDVRLAISDSLRETILSHREYADCSWAMGEDDLAVLLEIQGALGNEPPELQHAWLFSGYPSVPGASTQDYHLYKENLDQLRQQAVSEVLRVSSIPGIWTLGERAELPGSVGRTLGELPADPTVESEMLSRIAIERPLETGKVSKRFYLASSFASKRYSVDGEAWLERVLARPEFQNCRLATANLLSSLPPLEVIWDRAAAAGTEAHDAYWRLASVGYLTDYANKGARAVQELLGAQRPLRAMAVLYDWVSEQGRRPGDSDGAGPSLELVKSVLEQAGRSPTDRNELIGGAGLIGHRVETIFKWLDRSGVEARVLAELEWLWFPILKTQARGTLKLIEAVLTDAEFFVEVLQYAFRAEGESERDLSQEEAYRAGNAWELLHQVGGVPGGPARAKGRRRGRRSSAVPAGLGLPDPQSLRGWVEKARRLASECGRLKVCDSQIGEFLANSPPDEDGIRPCVFIRNLLEDPTACTRETLEGLRVGLYNARGLVERSGPCGDDERLLASEFRSKAEQVEVRWPRTAEVFRRLAETYEREGMRNDQRASAEEFE